MNPYSILLKKVLAVIAETMLPAFSGQTKMLEIALKMNYQNERFQHIKIIFWHPNSYMLVAYNFETHLDDIHDNDFSITANHDSTWKEDGLSFFPQIVKVPEEIDILSCKIVEIENPFVSDIERTFFFKRKEAEIGEKA